MSFRSGLDDGDRSRPAPSGPSRATCHRGRSLRGTRWTPSRRGRGVGRPRSSRSRADSPVRIFAPGLGPIEGRAAVGRRDPQGQPTGLLGEEGDPAIRRPRQVERADAGAPEDHDGLDRLDRQSGGRSMRVEHQDGVLRAAVDGRDPRPVRRPCWEPEQRVAGRREDARSAGCVDERERTVVPDHHDRARRRQWSARRRRTRWPPARPRRRLPEARDRRREQVDQPRRRDCGAGRFGRGRASSQRWKQLDRADHHDRREHDKGDPAEHGTPWHLRRGTGRGSGRGRGGRRWAWLHLR